MKRVMLLAFVMMVSMMSCNNEELFVEPVQEAIVDDQEEVGEDEVEDETEVDASLLCDFNFNTIEANATIILNCVLDLGGNTINIPEGVTFLFEGGDIINGTLNFSGGSVVSGELLNSTLTLGGSIPQLKDTTFSFNPQRWGIVEGKVADEIAQNNKDILQEIIVKTKSMGVDVFSIDKIDAYFKVGAYGPPKDVSAGGIEIPSNFHLKMSDDTYLRVQPNNFFYNYFISVFREDNVTISGGNLIGDRYEHDYGIPNGSYDTHEWPGLLVVSGAKNVLIDGVYMSDSTGDAFISGSSGTKRYKPEAVWTQNLTVRNCTMNASRRNNMSITDGADILIENCTITNAGMFGTPRTGDAYTSAGVKPKAGIDLEPFIGEDDNGNIKYFERVQRVTIRGCVFTDNFTASVINYSGENVIIEDNQSDNQLKAHYGFDTKFINNKLVANTSYANKAAISLGTSSNYEVIGNTITGFQIGITLNGDTGLVKSNTINGNVIGVQAKKANNFLVENNFLNGSSFNCYKSEGNVTFKNNIVKCKKYPISAKQSNISQESISNNYKIVFDNNEFEATEEGAYAFFDEANNNTIVQNNKFINCTLFTQNCTIIEINNTFN